MFDYSALFAQAAAAPLPLQRWLDQLQPHLAAALAEEAHGMMSQWGAAVAALPKRQPGFVELRERVQIGEAAEIDERVRGQLRAALMQLHPWRKGPFDIYGIHIDTEWRSDWKWARVQGAIAPLDGRIVLDVGCGNGYYGWRMQGAGAKLIIGLDPFLVYVMQFQAISRLLGETAAFVLPFGAEVLAPELGVFDTAFSMGVLYHRRSPFDHLLDLRGALRSGGELVLETLVIEGKVGEVLVPEGRYAQMRNVWFIPSMLTLESWLRKCSFKDVRLVDVTRTSKAEQRTTEWMRFHSLADFLSEDGLRTVEGHPAPMRAVFIAAVP